MSEFVPEIIRAERDLQGGVALYFKEPVRGEDKDLSFSLIQAGIAWPVRDKPGYVCIIGLLAGAKPCSPGSMMLIWEKEYSSYIDLTKEVLNKARDLRFLNFWTDRRHPDWSGFNFHFIQFARSMGDIRLWHSPFAEDFQFGVDITQRWGNDRVIDLPANSILLKQLLQMQPSDLAGERPGEKFNAVNAYRLLVAAYEKVAMRTPEMMPRESERVATPEGWA